VAARTVWAILHRAGVDAAQAKGILAGDLLAVDTVLRQRIYVFFIIEVATRRVQVLGPRASDRGVDEAAGTESGRGDGGAGNPVPMPTPNDGCAPSAASVWTGY
jgi:hypothetical protein